MQTIYCLSGLGANEKVFQFLDLSFAKPVFIQWLPPRQNETLRQYALRLKEEYITEPEPVIFGLSLGGMMAVEIAKVIPSSTAILISSAKTKKEIPFYLRMLLSTPVYKMVPEKVVRRSKKIQSYFLGAHLNSTKKYLRTTLDDLDIQFYRWALDALRTWKNDTVPSNVIHIHGTKDNLLPLKYVDADITVENGGHLMIVENAVEISACLKQIICKN